MTLDYFKPFEIHHSTVKSSVFTNREPIRQLSVFKIFPGVGMPVNSVKVDTI